MILCIERDVKHNIHQVKKKIDSHEVCSKCLPLADHKHASVLAIGQLRHQSVTAPISHATHAADTVAVHQFHELWFHAHVAE